MTLTQSQISTEYLLFAEDIAVLKTLLSSEVNALSTVLKTL